MPEIGWDQFEIEAEAVSEEDVKAIEEGPKGGFLGKCIAVVTGSEPKQMDFVSPPSVGVRLTFEIEKVLEIGVKKENENPKDDLDYTVVFEPATSQMSEKWVGEKIHDDLPFYYDGEPDWSIRRRKSIALKLGLIRPGETLVKSAWRERVLGQRVVIRTEENRYTDKKTGREKVGRPKVGFFDGYEKISTVEGEGAKETNWDDI